MGDYIKREDAKRAIRGNFHDFGTRCMINNVLNEVAKVSSDNLVEVVRCKDCKYYNAIDTDRLSECEKGFETYGNDYCSYGERKDEGL